MGAACDTQKGSVQEADQWYYAEDGPGVEYGVHVHGGFLARTIHAKRHHELNDKDGSPFKMFELHMEGQEESFGDVWQGNYDDEHKKIFADDIKGGIIRTAIKDEHAFLYRHRCDRSTTGTLDNAHDFLELLYYGIRCGRRRVFTYAMMDDGWFFSETGAGMVADVCSKHAVHANARGEVRFSGTMRIIKNATTGEHALAPDNDSGTYRPNAAQLPALVKCIQYNFPGLKVITLDACSPQPEDLKQWYGPDENKHTSESPVYPGKWVWQIDDDEEEGAYE